MKKIIGFSLISIMTLNPVFVKAGAIDMVNYPLSLIEKVQTSSTYTETFKTLEKAKEQKEKIEATKKKASSFKKKVGQIASVAVAAGAVMSVANEVFSEKNESPVVPKNVAEVADDQEAVKDEIVNMTNIEVSDETENLTQETHRMLKEQKENYKMSVLEGYATAISNRALISDIRLKLNDIQESIYSSEDNMGTYKVIPEISLLTSRELQKIIYLESIGLNINSITELNGYKLGFEDYVVNKKEGEE